MKKIKRFKKVKVKHYKNYDVFVLHRLKGEPLSPLAIPIVGWILLIFMFQLWYPLQYHFAYHYEYEEIRCNNLLILQWQEE